MTHVASGAPEMEGYLMCRVLCAEILARTLWITKLDCVFVNKKTHLFLLIPKWGGSVITTTFLL